MPKVKSLEWKSPRHGYNWKLFWSTQAVRSQNWYEIYEWEDYDYRITAPSGPIGSFKSLEEAKAACQAHWNSLVLSWLEEEEEEEELPEPESLSTQELIDGFKELNL